MIKQTAENDANRNFCVRMLKSKLQQEVMPRSKWRGNYGVPLQNSYKNFSKPGLLSCNRGKKLRDTNLQLELQNSF